MARFLKKVSERVAPPGLEWRLLKLMPRALFFGTLLPIVIAVGARLLLPGPAKEIAKQVKSIDIFAIALAATIWTAILTVTIGCVVVFVMKGPAYEADPYPVQHSDRPER